MRGICRRQTRRAVCQTLMLSACLLPIWSFQGCVTPAEGGQQFNILSTQEEIALGDKMAQQIETEEKVLNDASIQDYVGVIGERLARLSPRTDVPYKFTVIDNPETINAFALPGGHMYIYTGLLKLCDNEAQLASVMGHEIGHVAAKHHGESVTRQYGYSILMGIILGDKSSQGAQVLAQLVGTAGEMRFSRVQEHEADRLGMDLLWRAGYQPESMAAFMQKMQQIEQEKGGGRAPLPFFSSHPATADRITNLQNLALQYPADLRANSPTYTERYQEKVLGRLK